MIDAIYHIHGGGTFTVKTGVLVQDPKENLFACFRTSSLKVTPST